MQRSVTVTRATVRWWANAGCTLRRIAVAAAAVYWQANPWKALGVIIIRAPEWPANARPLQIRHRGERTSLCAGTRWARHVRRALGL